MVVELDGAAVSATPCQSVPVTSSMPCGPVPGSRRAPPASQRATRSAAASCPGGKRIDGAVGAAAPGSSPATVALNPTPASAAVASAPWRGTPVPLCTVSRTPAGDSSPAVPPRKTDSVASVSGPSTRRRTGGAVTVSGVPSTE